MGRDAEAAERTAALVSMGFTADEAAGALDATQGSLERAADWLLVNRPEEPEPEPEVEPEPEPSLPVEWHSLLEDLIEMGFEPEAAKAALRESDGDMKVAVRSLVDREREQR